MDYLKQFFKSAFSQYVEVVHDDMISFGYEKGLEIRDLRLKTQVINEALEASQSEARLECGRIGRMNLVYTPLPGIVTIQVKDLDIRVRPNFTGLALRKLFETLRDLGDLENPDLVAPRPPLPLSSATPLYSYYGPCPPSHCTTNKLLGPEIHNTQARLVHPCRIPRAPPIVRRARYIRALPSPSPHFQRPVRNGTCDTLPSFLLGGPSNMNLERFCPDLSGLSNSLTHARVFEGCEEIKNLLSNCVESVVSLTPPEYDRLEQIKLPSLRVRTSEIWREAMQQRAQRAATSNERVQLAQNSTIPQQSVTTLHGAFTEAPTPAAAAAAATAAAAAAAASAAGAKAAAAAAAAEPIKGYHHPLPNPSGLCMQNAPPPFVGPPPPLSFGFLPQTFHQQTAMTGCPQTTIAGNGAPLNAGFWGPPSAAAMTPAAAPLSSRQGLISPSSVARGYLQAPTAFTSSQQMHAKSLGLDLMAAAVDPPAFSIKGMPPDQHITAAFKAHSNL